MVDRGVSNVFRYHCSSPKRHGPKDATRTQPCVVRHDDIELIVGPIAALLVSDHSRGSWKGSWTYLGRW